MTCPTKQMLDDCMPNIPDERHVPPSVNSLVEDVIADAIEMQAEHMERKDDAVQR